jgi:hypothetical protein
VSFIEVEHNFFTVLQLSFHRVVKSQGFNLGRALIQVAVVRLRKLEVSLGVKPSSPPLRGGELTSLSDTIGAVKGNRTLVSNLASSRSTIELLLHNRRSTLYQGEYYAAKKPRPSAHIIYSL